MPSIDRLSCFPDDIICHILTFLPTKLSVRTSVLSKRWTFLWAHVPSLEYDDWDRPLNSEILNKILLKHKRDIHTLHLRGEFEGSAKEFGSCIVNIITRNILNLVIALVCPFEFPQSLFSCKTVVDFLFVCFDLIPKSGLYFPYLKKLELECYRHQYHESLARLLSGCPVLEEFSFVGMVLGQFSVSSSTLTRLVLHLDNEDIPEFGLMLDTPSLRYLHLNCPIPDKFSVGALDSLIEADISLFWEEGDQENFIYSRNALALVGKLHNVRLLSLWTGPGVMIHGPFLLGIKFHNLTKLDVSGNLGFIKSFLENANNLRVLRLDIRNTGRNDNQYYWMEPKCVPACLSLHLQTVNVCSFVCYEEEFDMIRYILRNAKVLKRMEVRTSEFEFNKLDLKKKFVAIKRLASFGRESRECELVFD